MIKRNRIEGSEKNIKEGGKGRKNGKRLVSVVMAAMIVVAAMTALVPIAAAGVTSFTIDPDTGVANATSAYSVTINTTGFTSLNITIPAGFEAVEPSDGDLIAEAWIQGTDSKAWYMNVTANGTDKVDVTAFSVYPEGLSDRADMTFPASYDPGGSINISSPWGGASYANLTLPKPGENGSLDVSSPGQITNVTINISTFVKNPAVAGDYDFIARADGETEGQTATVNVTTGVVTIEIPLQGGWNMVSLPIDPTNPSVSSVFADVNMYYKSVYTFDGSAYVPVTTVEPKKAYWVYSVGSPTITVSGSSITNTISFQGGWNMIGLPVAPTNPSVSSVFADVNMYYKSVYTFDGSAYVPVTTVEPKKGYWVYSVGSPTITVTGSQVTA